MNYRLTINPALEEGAASISFTYPTKGELECGVEYMANMLLFLQDDLGVMPDYSNSFVREELVNGKWEECNEL